jgi:chemotaxis response regulator CheB
MLKRGKGVMPITRVLVVDDFEPMWQLVCAALGETRALQVVGEASDGLEAIQKAVELKPGLILMDIGLQSLMESRLLDRFASLSPKLK